MSKLVYFVNNKCRMEIEQEKVDDTTNVYVCCGSAIQNSHILEIPPGDMVMLFNLYRYIKENDIQNDFLNPGGKNHG